MFTIQVSKARFQKCDRNRILSRRPRHSGFSLVELITVVAVIAILSSLMVSAFNSLGQAQNFASQVSDFQQLFDDARAYAMANNTYVLFGIEEVNASLPSSTVPQTLATPTIGGRIAVAVCATRDGTNGLPTSGTIAINTANLVAIHTLRLFPNIHLQSLWNINVPLSSPLANRYSITAGTGAQNTILLPRGQMLGYSSTIGGTFTWPLTGTTQYTFNRVVEFGPDGAVFFVPTLATTVSSASTSPKWLEIALQQTHGNAVPTAPTTTTLSNAKSGQQVAAIQVDGITGTSQLYRQ